jgi:hypothetical protein
MGNPVKTAYKPACSVIGFHRDKHDGLFRSEEWFVINNLQDGLEEANIYVDH